MGFDILNSLLIGSAIGKVLAKFLVYNLGLNFFTLQQIPGFSNDIALSKSFDIADFILTVMATLINYLVFRHLLRPKNRFLQILSLIFAAVIFLQVNFGFYSIALIIGLNILFYATLLMFSKIKIEVSDPRIDDSSFWSKLANGLLLGFYVLLVINTQTSTVFPLLALAITPTLFLFIKKLDRLSKSMGHMFFALSMFFPNNLLVLIIIGLISAVFVFALQNQKLTTAIRALYPIVFLVIISYNPLYYLGHLDVVEEGFWLGWVSGVSNGKALYKEIAAYHPPIVIWILTAFQRLFGFSISNTRLVLHMLQIVGMIFYYLAVTKILDKKLSRLVVMLLALSLTAIMVRNNVEFRLGVGLVGLAFISFPLVAGILAALSVLTSVEVGVAATVAIVIALGLAPTRRHNLMRFVLGFACIIFPVGLYLFARGALAPAISQISFYAQAFSQGYFNLPIERPVASAFIHWHFVNQYVSSYPFYWELARASIIAAFIIVFIGIKNAKLTTKSQTVLAFCLFGLIIFRSAMGRSDYYHLLFPLLVALPLLFFALEKINKKYSVPVFSFLLVFVFFRNIVHASFIEAKLYSLQTYGNAVGDQEEVLTKDQLALVDYIKMNTNSDQDLFVFPWNPEVYFLTNRPNASSHYVPYGFFTDSYQMQMIGDLKEKKPLVIYNPEMKFANLSPESLELVHLYILENYSETTSFGDYKIWKVKN